MGKKMKSGSRGSSSSTHNKKSQENNLVKLPNMNGFKSESEFHVVISPLAEMVMRAGVSIREDEVLKLKGILSLYYSKTFSPLSYYDEKSCLGCVNSLDSVVRWVGDVDLQKILFNILINIERDLTGGVPDAASMDKFHTMLRDFSISGNRELFLSLVSFLKDEYGVTNLTIFPPNLTRAIFDIALVREDVFLLDYLLREVGHKLDLLGILRSPKVPQIPVSCYAKILGHASFADGSLCVETKALLSVYLAPNSEGELSEIIQSRFVYGYLESVMVIIASYHDGGLEAEDKRQLGLEIKNRFAILLQDDMSEDSDQGISVNYNILGLFKHILNPEYLTLEQREKMLANFLGYFALPEELQVIPSVNLSELLGILASSNENIRDSFCYYFIKDDPGSVYISSNLLQVLSDTLSEKMSRVVLSIAPKIKESLKSKEGFDQIIDIINFFPKKKYADELSSESNFIKILCGYATIVQFQARYPSPTNQECQDVVEYLIGFVKAENIRGELFCERAVGIFMLPSILSFVAKVRNVFALETVYTLCCDIESFVEGDVEMFDMIDELSEAEICRLIVNLIKAGSKTTACTMIERYHNVFRNFSESMVLNKPHITDALYLLLSEGLLARPGDKRLRQSVSEQDINMFISQGTNLIKVDSEYNEKDFDVQVDNFFYRQMRPGYPQRYIMSVMDMLVESNCHRRLTMSTIGEVLRDSVCENDYVLVNGVMNSFLGTDSDFFSYFFNFVISRQLDLQATPEGREFLDSSISRIKSELVSKSDVTGERMDAVNRIGSLSNQVPISVDDKVLFSFFATSNKEVEKFYSSHLRNGDDDLTHLLMEHVTNGRNCRVFELAFMVGNFYLVDLAYQCHEKVTLKFLKSVQVNPSIVEGHWSLNEKGLSYIDNLFSAHNLNAQLSRQNIAFQGVQGELEAKKRELTELKDRLVEIKQVESSGIKNRAKHVLSAQQRERNVRSAMWSEEKVRNNILEERCVELMQEKNILKRELIEQRSQCARTQEDRVAYLTARLRQGEVENEQAQLKLAKLEKLIELLVAKLDLRNHDREQVQVRKDVLLEAVNQHAFEVVFEKEKLRNCRLEGRVEGLTRENVKLQEEKNEEDKKINAKKGVDRGELGQRLEGVSLV